MLSPRVVWLPFAVICVALALPGCSQTTVAGRSRMLRVGLSEYRLTPQRLRARTGPLTITARNFGHLAHNLAILRGSRIVAETSPIAPGWSATLSLDLPPGSYTIGSNLFEDQSLGTYGTLIVAR